MGFPMASITKGGGEMKAERLAEFQEARLRILAGDMPEEPVSAAFIELIDALTAERARAEQADIHDHLISTEPLYAWANKRIEMLEEENKRIKELEAEVARLASLKSSPGCCDKAAKYDSICEQFPYMPGAVVWILQDGAIQRATVWRIGERVARVLLDEIAIDVDPSRLHPTADACRAAIPVEEK